LFFETGLLHLTWYPPIPSIYLQATCHISYSWVKLHCVYIPHFLDLFISCRETGLFPKLGYYD
jgi:hypothetical protein